MIGTDLRRTLEHNWEGVLWVLRKATSLWGYASENVRLKMGASRGFKSEANKNDYKLKNYKEST